MKEYKNKNGGFTMVETLSVVVIMIILLAFGIVGVARYRDYLKITELDNMAREIYMAAQNRAVLLQNSGRLQEELNATGTAIADPTANRIAFLAALAEIFLVNVK